MKVFLHIGTFKTGSTALQNVFTKNKEILKQAGIYWGEYAEQNNTHANLMYGLLKNALIKKGIWERYKEHPRFRYLAGDPKDIIENMKNSAEGYQAVIISHEAFFADSFRTLCGLEEVYDQKMYDDINYNIRTELYELISDWADEIEIVCYLRRQDLFLESQYNQYCKSPWYSSKKRIVEFQEFIASKPITLDYMKTMSEWKAVFAKAKFTIKPYEKSQMENGLINDFMKNVLCMDASYIDKLKKIEKTSANLRWDRDVLEYKKLVQLENTTLNQIFDNYSLEIENIVDYAYFTEDERKDILKRYELCNVSIAKEYRNKPELFIEKNEVPQYEGLSKEKVAEITKYVLVKML